MAWNFGRSLEVLEWSTPNIAKKQFIPTSAILAREAQFSVAQLWSIDTLDIEQLDEPIDDDEKALHADIIESTPLRPTDIIPHQTIWNEQMKKLRVVYDASAGADAGQAEIISDNGTNMALTTRSFRVSRTPSIKRMRTSNAAVEEEAALDERPIAYTESDDVQKIARRKLFDETIRRQPGIDRGVLRQVIGFTNADEINEILELYCERMKQLRELDIDRL
uniref:Uncharacterized protein n=1 Tax=Parascaris univalens TaxID=6257 RepID=A0A914ZYX4_PARUN